MTSMKLLEKLNWRYATKQFDPQKKVSEDKFKELLESLRLSASSFGLQPWKFVVVRNPKIREELKGASWNQSQITDASHLVVLCSLKEITVKDVEKFVSAIAKTRGMDPSMLENYKQMMAGFVSSKNAEELRHWMDRQVYIALGTLLTACAVNDIDACPMEGFDPKKYDEVLHLDKKGARSVVVCAIGHRSAEDTYAQLKKVRFPVDEVIIDVK